MHWITIIAALLVGSLFFSGERAAAAAAAQVAECTVIAKFPAVISKPGRYCLGAAGKPKKVSVKLPAGSAISITVDGVMLDLNGSELANTAKENSATAIQGDQSNISIRNGSITGFSRGIRVGNVNAAGNVVEQMTIRALAWGLDVRGGGSVIRNNTVSGIGEGTRYGIYSEGSGVRIMNNEVADVQNKPILVSLGSDDRTIVDGNTVSATSLLPGAGIGINTTSAMVMNNRVSNMEVGIRFYQGAQGEYQNNLTRGCATPYLVEEDALAVDAGNNQ